MKDFLLIANQNAITYKEFFPLLKEKKVFMGVSKPKEYILTDGTTQKFGNICWFSTIASPARRKLTLSATYDPEKYPKYDNYEAIEVSRIKDIPMDYEGVMGCPITVLEYDLDNVEVVGKLVNGAGAEYYDYGRPTIRGGVEVYARVLIKRTN